ncbi:MAG TPA: sugar phosphate nucleotidyltransferase [Gemmatimonadaceae bacterium]|nr:sugar phosphate nucleotidyltransferase [Gemmatimonadaceae bacterium]
MPDLRKSGGPATRWAVVLAGGIGSRFWPLSTPDRPKQLLPLVDREPLIANAVRRLAPVAQPVNTLVLTNSELRDAMARALPGIPSENVIAEPRPSGTAAALTWAASEIVARETAAGRSSNGVMICIHADWSIRDDAAFTAALQQAADLAEAKSALVTVGIVPTRPDTGFGYIEPGAAAGAGFRVRRFIEKPDREGAKLLVSSGALWNSGIFCWRAADFLNEVRRHTPEIAPALERHAGARGRSREEFFAFVKSISVDVGVLERSANILVVRGEFGWDDVGTWGALLRARAPDNAGNVAQGRTHLLESTNNVVHAEGGSIVLYGVRDLVVVSRPGLTLVTTVEKSEDLKTLVDSLPAEIKAGA